jgi:hypothetical protein
LATVHGRPVLAGTRGQPPSGNTTVAGFARELEDTMKTAIRILVAGAVFYAAPAPHEQLRLEQDERRIDR